MNELPGRSTEIDAAGQRLRVLTHGDGRPILVLPGITSPAAVWDFIAQPLGTAGNAVHVLDLRGRGLSPPSSSPSYTLADYAADAAAVVRALGLRRPAVVGHSLGARIAAAFAVAAPEVPGGLVLVDPPLSGPGREPYPYPLSSYTDAIAQAKRGELTAAAVGAAHPGWTEGQVHARLAWLGTCDENAVAATHRHFHDEDFHALWERLDSPVLISGADSPVVDDAGRDELLRMNPSARSIVIEGAGHMVPWDRPAEFLGALTRALSVSGGVR